MVQVSTEYGVADDDVIEHEHVHFDLESAGEVSPAVARAVSFAASAAAAATRDEARQKKATAAPTATEASQAHDICGICEKKAPKPYDGYFDVPACMPCIDAFSREHPQSPEQRKKEKKEKKKDGRKQHIAAIWKSQQPTSKRLSRAKHSIKSFDATYLDDSMVALDDEDGEEDEDDEDESATTASSSTGSTNSHQQGSASRSRPKQGKKNMRRINTMTLKDADRLELKGCVLLGVGCLLGVLSAALCVAGASFAAGRLVLQRASEQSPQFLKIVWPCLLLCNYAAGGVCVAAMIVGCSLVRRQWQTTDEQRLATLYKRACVVAAIFSCITIAASVVSFVSWIIPISEQYWPGPQSPDESGVASLLQ